MCLGVHKYYAVVAIGMQSDYVSFVNSIQAERLDNHVSLHFILVTGTFNLLIIILSKSLLYRSCRASCLVALFLILPCFLTPPPII